MQKKIVISALLLAAASCHTHHDAEPRDHAVGENGKSYEIRLNPPVGSTYRYVFTSETSLMAQGPEMDTNWSTHSDITVHFQVSKDSNEFLMEMTFDKIHVHSRNGNEVIDADAGDRRGGSYPLNKLLSKLKTTTIFARLKPSGSGATFGGGTEAVDEFVTQCYAEADREQAKTYWEKWVEREIIWKCIDPFDWALPDTAQHIGGNWTGWTTNTEDINFKIENHFQFQSVNAGVASILSRGILRLDSSGTWLRDKKIAGLVNGQEMGICLVDLATGMPASLGDSLHVGGLVQIDGRATDISLQKTLKVAGERVN